MHFTSLLALIGATHAMQLEARNSSSIAVDVAGTSSELSGWADIDLVGMAAEGLTKRKAMTYCANSNSVTGKCSCMIV